MTQPKKDLVLGAGGHLGNNLVRALLERNEQPVRVSIRNPSHRRFFEDLDVEVAQADLMDRDSLLEAMSSVRTLYLAAAVYRSWSPNVQRDIIDVNIQGTKNALEIAALQEVEKIVYVSSTFTLDHTETPTAGGWNRLRTDPYAYSKTEAEKTAWELAEKHGLWMVSVLPSGMIGPNCFARLTPTMELMTKILKNALPFDPHFRFNLVDIRDVAKAMTNAGNGTPGTRYILAQEDPISSSAVLQLAQELYPNTRMPRAGPPYAVMYTIAFVMECISALTRKPPLMLRSQVHRFRQTDFRYDTNRSRKDLSFNPRSSTEALKDAFRFVAEASRDPCHTTPTPLWR